MRAEHYPNLELLVYKAKELLTRDEEFVKALEKAKSEKRITCITNFTIEVFPQMWGSTCTGFDEAEDGSPAFGGCAMTEEYTTVVLERITNTYVVFFGERACYKVQDANDNFIKDLNSRQLAGLHTAKKRY